VRHSLSTAWVCGGTHPCTIMCGLEQYHGIRVAGGGVAVVYLVNVEKCDPLGGSRQGLHCRNARLRWRLAKVRVAVAAGLAILAPTVHLHRRCRLHASTVVGALHGPSLCLGTAAGRLVACHHMGPVCCGVVCFSGRRPPQLYPWSCCWEGGPAPLGDGVVVDCSEDACATRETTGKQSEVGGWWG
jgi:hypothetical protein